MSGQDVLRERIARALWEEHYRKVGRLLKPYGECHPAYERDADAVIAALGLREMVDGEGHYWQTPWERTEEDQ